MQKDRVRSPNAPRDESLGTGDAYVIEYPPVGRTGGLSPQQVPGESRTLHNRNRSVTRGIQVNHVRLVVAHIPKRTSEEAADVRYAVPATIWGDDC